MPSRGQINCALNFLTHFFQFEAQLLSGCSISNEAEAIEAMKVLHSKGVKIVILSSVDFATSTKEESICLASQKLEDGTFETARIAFPTLPVHFVGTGEKSEICI